MNDTIHIVQNNVFMGIVSRTQVPCDKQNTIDGEKDHILKSWHQLKKAKVLRDQAKVCYETLSWESKVPPPNAHPPNK